MTENNNRVCCLYRVSTDKQVDFNSNHEADLPMQRKACHKFAESKGWVIVHEEQEEGVSGPVSYTHLDVYKRQDGKQCLYPFL